MVTTTNPAPTTAPTPAPVVTAKVSEQPTSGTAKVGQKGAPSIESLSISEAQELLSIYEAKKTQGILSVSEAEAMKPLQEKTNTGGKNNTADLGNKDGDTPEDPDPDKKGPFKEGDIIKYMYEDWLIAGANWLYCKAGVKLEKGYYAAQRAISERRRKKQAEKGRTDATQDAHNLISDTFVKSGEKSEKAIDEHRKKQLENLKLLKEGNFADANVSNTTKVLMANMDDKERKEFTENAAQGINNFYDNMQMAEQFSSNYARAGMTLDIAQNKDFYKENPQYKGKSLDKIFEEQKRGAMILFARRLDEEQRKGGDPLKLAAKLFKDSQKALEATDKTIDKRQYNEKNKKPITSSASYINDISDELKSVATPALGQKMGLYETTIAQQDFNVSVKLDMDRVTKGSGELLMRRDDVNGRRDRIQAFKEQLGIKPGDYSTEAEHTKNLQKQVSQNKASEFKTQIFSGSTGLGR